MKPATSPVIKSKSDDKLTHLDFNHAVRQIIKGKKIHKLEWNNKQNYVFLKDKVLLLHKEDEKDYQWILSLGDLEGTYYIIL